MSLPERDLRGRSEKAVLTGNVLKTIAIAAMLIDHIAHAFVPETLPIYYVMRFIGRITGPTMFYFIVEGYHYTRNKNKYTLRLALFAIISYFPFVLFVSGPESPITGNFLRLNVIYTLFIGLLALRARHEIKNVFLKYLVIAVLVVLALPGDWSYLAVMMIITFDVFRGDFKKQAFGYLLIIMSFGGLLSVLLYPLQAMLFGLDMQLEMLLAYVSEFGMILPIILLYFYNGQKGRGGAFTKWGFYIFYPAHLLILGIINYLINMR